MFELQFNNPIIQSKPEFPFEPVLHPTFGVATERIPQKIAHWGSSTSKQRTRQWILLFSRFKKHLSLTELCEWWLVRKFLFEKASAETNRDTSAPGSELPHYCSATFCQPLMTNPPQCVRQIRFLPSVDNISEAICRTNPTRQFRWSVICYLHGLHLSEEGACQQRNFGFWEKTTTSDLVCWGGIFFW